MKTTLRILIAAALLATAGTTIGKGMPAWAAGPVTTLDQQVAIWNEVIPQVEKNPATLVTNLPGLVPEYGNWCGLQATPAGAVPIDGVDAACEAHDLSPGYTAKTPTLEQVVQADTQLVSNLSRAVPSTPYGELYKEGAIQVFQAKTTYEQANQTLLLKDCADCPKNQ